MISLQDRIRGMIWGALVGDAASLGTHWIYDLREMQKAYPDGVNGFEKPHAEHYHFGKRPGDQTHYGDAALLLLESVAALGRFDLADFARRFCAFFTGSKCRSYKDHSTRETLKHLAVEPDNLANGANDDQPATVTRLAPIVAICKGPGELDAQIERLTLFSQNHPRAVAYAQAHAQILAALLRGENLEAALDCVSVDEPRQKIGEARAVRTHSILDAAMKFGQGCPLAKTFPAAVHAAIHSGSDFTSAILATIRSGGDSAARGAMIGAWLGAHHGVETIPLSWRNQLTHSDEISRNIERLFASEPTA